MQQTYSLFKALVFLCFTLSLSFNTLAVDIWKDVSGKTIISQTERYIIPAAYKTFQIDLEAMRAELATAPKEFSVDIRRSSLVLELPMPDGSMQRFAIVESSLMPDVLAAKFPSIKSYTGQGLDDGTATVRLSISHNGFHAMVVSVKGSVYIDPFSLNNTEHCISYYKEDFYATTDKFREGECVIGESAAKLGASSAPSGEILRTYRAAIACSGEYAQFHGGTVADAMAAINTTLNRVNEVYEREASFRLVLIENNDDIIYTDGATDPYTNGNSFAMLGENQINVEAVIGETNYDIGHVFGKDSGGVAGLGVVCTDGQKARGITGHSSPIGDPFDIDYVAHEMGHQFGAEHTFNGDTGSGNCGGGNRSPNTAYEPGSATTILGYAGICQINNLQPNSDDYYHTASFDQMVAHVNGEGWATDCAEHQETGNNTPIANAGNGGYTIPVGTPFELTGSGNDGDAADVLTYCWEEFDLGPATDISDNTLTNPSGNAPIFRSWSPVETATRVFPRLQDLVNNTTTMGELLPTYSRDLTFRLTVRDNHAGGGGVHHDQIAFEVSDAAGPFLVNSISEDWEYGNNYTVLWDVAGTDIAPISCSQVDIYLSLDGGFTYDILLAESVPNNGTVEIECPNVVSGQARVKVKAANNIFFDINNSNFDIVEPTEPNFVISMDPVAVDICNTEAAVFNVEIGAILGFNTPVDLTIEGVPELLLVTFDPAQVLPGDNSTLTISSPLPVPAGEYPFTVTGTADDKVHTAEGVINVYEGIPEPAQLLFPIAAIEDVSLTPTFSWVAQDAAASYTLQIASDENFENIIHTEENITDNSFAYEALLDPLTTYFWQLMSNSPCGDSEYGAFETFVSGEAAVTEIPGCTDPTAFNYDPTATVDDGSCVPYTFGCTNPEAVNYNAEANQDDGSCIIEGCMNPVATNYNPEANSDDGSCIIEGCTDPTAYNYNPEANLDDNSCINEEEGCTDPEAYNYNPNANTEDGSCDYTSLVIIMHENMPGGNHHFWAILNDLPTVSYLQWFMDDGTVYTAVDEPIHFYEENGSYTVMLKVFTVSAVYIATKTIVVSDLSEGCTDPQALNYDADAEVDNGTCIDIVEGCTDPLALNYNQLANVDDGSCIAGVPGCMDETAINFDESANVEDGSCEYTVDGCTDPEALNYNAEANTDDGSCEYPLPTEPNWTVDVTSNNHIILIPETADITINDLPIEIGDYLGVFFNGDDGELHCAGSIIWNGITTTMAVYGAEVGENNGFQIGETFKWITWKANINEYRMATADYDATMPSLDTYQVDGISAITALSNTMIQYIDMPEGWNLISTYIVPDYPEMEDFFAPVLDDLFLAKDEMGNVYWPDWSLNNIGAHTMGKAYKVKMNADAELEVRGAISNPLNYELSLLEGWSYLGYLRNVPADITVVFESVEDDILLIKDGIGNIYWPEFGVNTLGNIEPGKGYQIRMYNDAVFTYPSNDIVLPELRLAESADPVYYAGVEKAEFNMTLGFTADVLSALNVGDEIAVKNIEGVLMGSAVYTGANVAMTVWGAEQASEFTLSAWSAIEQREIALELNWTNGSNNFANNAIQTASSVEVLAKLTEVSIISVIPNPATNSSSVSFTAIGEEKVVIALYNTLGEQVIQIANANFKAGAHKATINCEHLPSGIYFLRLEADSNKETKLFQIVK